MLGPLLYHILQAPWFQWPDVIPSQCFSSLCKGEPTADGLLRYRLGSTRGEDIPGLFCSKPPVAICAHMYQ